MKDVCYPIHQLRSLDRLEALIGQVAEQRDFGDELTILLIDEFGDLVFSLKKFMETETADSDMYDTRLFLADLIEHCRFDWSSILQGRDREFFVEN